MSQLSSSYCHGVLQSTVTESDTTTTELKWTAVTLPTRYHEAAKMQAVRHLIIVSERNIFELSHNNLLSLQLRK